MKTCSVFLIRSEVLQTDDVPALPQVHHLQPNPLTCKVKLIQFRVLIDSKFTNGKGIRVQEQFIICLRHPFKIKANLGLPQIKISFPESKRESVLYVTDQRGSLFCLLLRKTNVGCVEVWINDSLIHVEHLAHDLELSFCRLEWLSLIL